MKLKQVAILAAALLVFEGSPVMAAKPLTVPGCKADFNKATKIAVSQYQANLKKIADKYKKDQVWVKTNDIKIRPNNEKAILNEKNASEKYAKEDLETAKKSASRYLQDCSLVAGNGGEDKVEMVAKKFAIAAVMNYFDYLNSHTYCDSKCATTIKKELGLTPAQEFAIDEKLSSYEVKNAADNIKLRTINKTTSTASFIATYDFFSRDASGGSGLPLAFRKIGPKWMADYNAILDSAILIDKNYLKLTSDLKKCQAMGKVSFDVPTAGGTFSVSDPGHPLYGLSIRIPKVKDGFKITVGCSSDFIEHVVGGIFISLPIDIETDKQFVVVDPDTAGPSFGPLSPKKLESDPVYAGKWPLIKIPYSDLAANDSGMAMVMRSNRKPGEQMVGRGGDLTIDFGDFEPEKKVAWFYFRNFNKTWVLYSDGVKEAPPSTSTVK